MFFAVLLVIVFPPSKSQTAQSLCDNVFNAFENYQSVEYFAAKKFLKSFPFDINLHYYFSIKLSNLRDNQGMVMNKHFGQLAEPALNRIDKNLEIRLGV
ncbi:25786_t:CDS:2, partial [Gigaspora margarita]